MSSRTVGTDSIDSIFLVGELKQSASFVAGDTLNEDQRGCRTMRLYTVFQCSTVGKIRRHIVQKILSDLMGVFICNSVGANL